MLGGASFQSLSVFSFLISEIVDIFSLKIMITRLMRILPLLSILCSMLSAQYWEGDLLLGPSSYHYLSNLQNELDNDISGPGGPGGGFGPPGPPGPPGGPGGPGGLGGPGGPYEPAPLPFGYREGLKILNCNPDAQGSITIPSNVTEIGPRAFVNCNNITSISIGKRGEAVKDEVFLVHGGAFSDSEKLNAIFVDKEVRIEIAEPYLAQFNENTNSKDLLSLSLSSQDIIVDNPSFGYTGILPRLILGAGSDTNYDHIFRYYNYRHKSIHHPDSWISENIILKDEISFETDTFSYGLNFRNNYTLIGAVDTLPSIIDIPSIVNGYIVDEIGPAAFYDNQTITEVKIPGTVKIIGDNAFSGCSSLVEIKMNEGLEIISGLSFSGCISLESIIIPESVIKMEEFAFSGCDSLSKVTILGNNFFATDPYYTRLGGPFEDPLPPIIQPVVHVESKSSGWQYPQTRIGYSFIDIKFNPSITLSDSYQIKLGDSLSLSALSYDLFKDYDGDGNLDVDEDINENGNLDPGEDIDADGKLDQSEPLTETVNGYQWYYGVFPISQSLGGNDENFTILGEEQYEGFWKLELLQDDTVISSHEFYVSVYNDTDSDGLHDAFETGTGVFISADNTGTDPNNADSDGDTLTDGDEILIHQTDPNNADSDGDTLTDGDEILIHQTDPNNTDSDGDTILDHTEIMNGTNPNLADTDSDGLDDAQEITYGTDPNLADTSGDGLSDGIIVNAGFDPTVDYSNLLNQRPTQASYDAVVAERDAKLTIDEIQDLRPGSTMIEVSENQATIQLQMEESSDLQTWEDTGTPATMTISADTDTKFFRFKMAE